MNFALSIKIVDSTIFRSYLSFNSCKSLIDILGIDVLSLIESIKLSNLGNTPLSSALLEDQESPNLGHIYRKSCGCEILKGRGGESTSRPKIIASFVSILLPPPSPGCTLHIYTRYTIFI